MKTLMLKVLTVVFFLALSFSFSPLVYAETHDDEEGILANLKVQIEELFKKIEDLKERFRQAEQDKVALREEVREIRGFTQDLVQGLTNDDVKDLQELLSAYPDIYPEGLITGYFGPLTKKAVERYQRTFGLGVTGIVGPATRTSLNSLIDDGVITDEELTLLPLGIREARGLDKPLPPGILKNLQNRRGFAHQDVEAEEESDKADDKENVDQNEAEVAKAEAQTEVDRVIELIAEAKDANEETGASEVLIAEALEKLTETEEFFDDEDYEESKDLAEGAKELAEMAEEYLGQTIEELEEDRV